MQLNNTAEVIGRDTFPPIFCHHPASWGRSNTQAIASLIPSTSPTFTNKSAPSASKSRVKRMSVPIAGK
ncbi:MAG: hypothetical protein ACHBN1_02860 [Heteroscytonema crispum UTEX LB 1556]